MKPEIELEQKLIREYLKNNKIKYYIDGKIIEVTEKQAEALRKDKNFE